MAVHNANRKPNVFIRLKMDIIKNPYIYLMLLPVLLYYLLFCYKPMYGILMAFKDFTPRKGIWGSPWTDLYGMKYFYQFFTGPYFWRTLRNTILINFWNLLVNFPAPIILALLLNELKDGIFKRTVQTITYMPHFISTVVIVGIIKALLSYNGVLTDLFTMLGMERTNIVAEPQFFRAIYVLSDMWQGIGWGTIIYLAAISSVDYALYEAAKIDGAGRLRRAISITIPGIVPTIVILLILRIGSMMSLGHEKIILLYSPNTYETADVISSYVYRIGIEQGNFSYSTAVGLFNSVINFLLVIGANKFSKKMTETSLW
jgi:putative aldouronate transport system permease protein